MDIVLTRVSPREFVDYVNDLLLLLGHQLRMIGGVTVSPAACLAAARRHIRRER